MGAPPQQSQSLSLATKLRTVREVTRVYKASGYPVVPASNIAKDLAAGQHASAEVASQGDVA